MRVTLATSPGTPRGKTRDDATIVYWQQPRAALEDLYRG
jgi:hypothetical protein